MVIIVFFLLLLLLEEELVVDLFLHKQVDLEEVEGLQVVLQLVQRELQTKVIMVVMVPTLAHLEELEVEELVLMGIVLEVELV
jgi:hypothetical protein